MAAVDEDSVTLVVAEEPEVGAVDGQDWRELQPSVAFQRPVGGSYSWHAANVLGPVDNSTEHPLQFQLVRIYPNGSQSNVLVVPLSLDEVHAVDVATIGRAQAALSMEQGFLRLMAWRDVEEIAAFVQSWGAEYAPVADAIRERWMAATRVVPLDAPPVEVTPELTASIDVAALRAAVAELINQCESHNRSYGHRTPTERLAELRTLLDQPQTGTP